MDKDGIQEMLPLTFPTTITTVNDIGQNLSFEIKVECKAKDFETWLKEFENITKTNYTIRNKSCKGQLYERSIYATCHHNTYGKLPDKENFKYGSKNTQCPAKIQMKKTRPLLDCLNTYTLITVRFNHNHPILAADSLRFRKPSKIVEEKFLKLFQSGHTPASSIQAHNLDIILENPDGYEVILSDNSLSPNYQWVYRLHKKVANSNYGSSSLSNIKQADLIKKLALEKDCCCKIVEDGDQVAIVLVTKMMLRISLMPELGESCFIDSSGGVDRDGTRFFILLGRCHAGGVPLAVVLATSENQNILAGAFKAIQELLPKLAFGGRSNLIGPLTFMTDDCTAERNALRQVWPKAAVLLCTFHVLQALWRWLFDKKHAIELNDRSNLLNLFKVIMCAPTEEQLENLYQGLLNDTCAKKYPNYLKHIESYVNRRTKWALCYRNKLLVRGNNTNNICESAMMIMKDYILQRVKAYNIVQVADFVISRLDLYFEQKILKVAFNRLTSTSLCKLAFLDNNVEFAKDKIIKVENNIYSVPSEKSSNKRYSVNMDLAHCECPIGNDGRLCKHQVAVAKFMNVTNQNIMPLNDPKQKQYLYYIATGKEMEEEFFHSLRTQIKQEGSCNKLTISASKSGNMDNSYISNDESNQNILDNTCFGDDDDMQVDIVDEIPKQEAQMTILEAEENLKNIFNDLLNKSKEKPDIYLPAIQAFSNKYKQIKTDANLISSLYCFGKGLNESTSSTNVYTVKRRGKKIRVQPTSVSRRRNLHLGRGTSSSINIGRPRKHKELQEHKYASHRQLSKAPHSLASCVTNNISIGR